MIKNAGRGLMGVTAGGGAIKSPIAGQGVDGGGRHWRWEGGKR